MKKNKEANKKKLAGSSDRKCFFNCSGNARLVKFPDNWETRETWFKALNLLEYPSQRTSLFLCIKHFSRRQLTEDGKSITTMSVPDRNIPGKWGSTDSDLELYSPNQSQNESADDDDEDASTLSKPSSNTEPEIPIKNAFMKNMPYRMVTSKNSKCILKCKPRHQLHKFPDDLISYNIWLKKLDLPEGTKLRRTYGLCGYHFSPLQRTGVSRINRCAVPDIYLPSNCTFVDESEIEEGEVLAIGPEHNKPEENLGQIISDQSINNPQSLPTPIVPIVASVPPVVTTNGTPPSTPSAKNNVPGDVTSNSNANAKAVVIYHTAKKEPQFLAKPVNMFNTTVFVPPVVEEDSQNPVICPKNYKTAHTECVLNCPNPKTLFRFPTVESRRQLWLSKIGLTHCFNNSRICCKHFSKKMMRFKRPSNTAYPDKDLPTKLASIQKPAPPQATQLPNISYPTYPDTTMLQPVQVPRTQRALYEVGVLPEFISVLTIFATKTKPPIETKYVQYDTSDKDIPMQDRQLQVGGNSFVQTVNVGVMADDDFGTDDENVDIFENINIQQQQPDLIEDTHMQKFYQVFPTKTKDLFECLKCGNVYVSKMSMLNHLATHRECLCCYCGQKFSNEMALKKHEMKAHLIEIKKLLRCPIEGCKKVFHSKRNFNRHLDAHSGPTRYFCVNCSRLFFSSLKMQCHLLACRSKMKRSRIH